MRQAKTCSARQSLLPALALVTVAVLWLALDQLTKVWATQALSPGQSIPVLGEFLELHLAYNPGAAFSFLANATWVFTLLAAVTVVIIVLQLRRIKSLRWAVAIGLLLGGCTGNLLDRLFRPPGFAVGHVVDFIYTPAIVPAVYNFADIGLCVAVGLLILLMLTNVAIDPTRKVAQ